jgi:Rod binding domain-containing protein
VGKHQPSDLKRSHDRRFGNIIMTPLTNAMQSPAATFDFANTARGALSPGKDKNASVATDFESLFTSQLLKEMRKSLDPETMFGSDPGDVYGGMFDQFVGQQMANSGGIGIAKMVRETLKRENDAKAGTVLGSQG